MASSTPATTPRMLRLSISIYRNGTKTPTEAHEFATNNHAVQAAKLHAKNGINTCIQYFSPDTFKQIIQGISDQRNRGCVVDDHDMTVDFYFRTFAELNAVTNDPEFQKLQREEEGYVDRRKTVVSLGWVERYVQGGEVVNVRELEEGEGLGRSMYESWEESADLSTLGIGEEHWKKGAEVNKEQKRGEEA